jgi:4-amino-4-deoxy-L-arabinose transferase-like glycosyltransferase
LDLAISFVPSGVEDSPIHWKKMVGMGLCLGAAVLLRQLFLIFVPLLFLWFYWVKRWQWRKALIGLIPTALVIVLMILPFTVYNYSRFDRFVLLNTNSGFAFFWGNHPIYGTHFIPILPAELGTYQDLIPPEVRHLDEAALDQELMRRGLQFTRDDPGRYFLLSLSRIPALFMFWPSADSGLISNLSRVGSFGILWPFMLAGLVLAVIRSRASSGSKYALILFTSFIVVYVGIHLLSWALIRYRLPVDAVMLVFAGYSFDALIMGIRQRLQMRHPTALV